MSWFHIIPMRNPMNLTGLHLLLSYRCTYECDHCFVRSSPFAAGTMTLSFVRDVLQQAADAGTITSIYFEGGEPFLYYPILLQGVKEARAKGFDVGIVSNGWFAETVEDALEWLRPFADMGEVAFSFSDDDYHGDASSEETPAARARQAAAQLGMEAGSIAIEPPCGEYDPQTPGEPILGGGVRFRGRAVEKLADKTLPRRTWESFDHCPDEDWDEIGRLHLDAYGNLFNCQGIVLGNLQTQTLREVIDSWEPDSHPIVGPLKRGGPAELVRFFDLDLQGRYLDACHLCFLARKVLLDRYPDLLAPTQVYRDV
ncbi:radical SAM protein [bacterium]|nr:radical SAM protein [bacterium]